MQRHRFVESEIARARSAVAFPGTPMPEPAGARERLASGGASLLLHGALVLALVLVADAARDEIEEQIIEVTRVDEPSQEEPAPRPRAIAEQSARFAPAPMAVEPQILNPTVIQPRVADVRAAEVHVADVQPVQAPRQIAPIQAPEVAQVRAYQSPIAANAAAPRVLDTAAPQLSGPVDFQAPAGTLAGPRQVVTGGSTVGIADPTALGTGSSVEEGIASDRDVLGGKTGERASVNTAVGAGGGRGTGGTGTGPGGVSYENCQRRPEVSAYIAHVRERMYARWRVPDSIPSKERVQLRFRLDPSGSASNIEFVTGGSAALGQTAVEAMRAASPFDPMPVAARCLANDDLIASFSLPE